MPAAMLLREVGVAANQTDTRRLDTVQHPVVLRHNRDVTRTRQRHHLACLREPSLLRRSEHLPRVAGSLIFFMLLLGAIGGSKGVIG